jgi:phthalate 4,5-dioxygenase oxygenase subunit
MDDENCMAWTWTFHPTRALSNRELELMKGGAGVHAEMIPGTFRPVANRSNDYLIDRAAQKDGRYYNGVKGLAIQDAAVQESMGSIADRSIEHLVATDAAIIKVRQRLHDAARAVERGQRPPGLEPEAQYVRSASFVLPIGADFEDKAVDAVKVRAGEEHVAV